MTVRFLRNKVVEVDPQSDGSLAVSWRLSDDLLKAEVNLKVRLPDLEIVEAEAELARLVPRAWSSADEIIKKVENYNRGYYTGIFGYFDGNDIDSGVMIRFIEKVGSKMFFKSGGGITVNSDLKIEYEELINKIYVPLI